MLEVASGAYRLKPLRKIVDGRMTVFDQFMANVQFAVNRSVTWPRASTKQQPERLGKHKKDLSPSRWLHATHHLPS